ncbi:MAG: DegV family protein [Bacillota bacterium]
MKIKIITDSNIDLPKEYLWKNELVIVPFTFSIKGKSYTDDFGRSIGYKEFYNEMRMGEMPTTSQITPFTFEEAFRKYIAEGYSIIYIGFSSVLSQTYNNALVARNIIINENTNADISVIDSRSATIGQGLIVYYACEMLKQGKSKEEIINWVESNKLKVNHLFTVDNLNHLKRGGRISSTSAVLGTIIDVKPILFVDNQGGLTFSKKVRGRKKSINILAEELQKRIINPEEQMIFICHGDSVKDAELLKKAIIDKVNVKGVIINYTGPVVGSHTGPGMLAVMFLGDNRTA